jgi:hypothetical protein
MKRNIIVAVSNIIKTIDKLAPTISNQLNNINSPSAPFIVAELKTTERVNKIAKVDLIDVIYVNTA